jgi:hypothetical protein
LLSSDIVVANIIAAPSPWTPRAAISIGTLTAAPDAAEDAANSNRLRESGTLLYDLELDLPAFGFRAPTTLTRPLARNARGWRRCWR